MIGLAFIALTFGIVAALALTAIVSLWGGCAAL